MVRSVGKQKLLIAVFSSSQETITNIGIGRSGGMVASIWTKRSSNPVTPTFMKWLSDLVSIRCQKGCSTLDLDVDKAETFRVIFQVFSRVENGKDLQETNRGIWVRP